MGLLLFNSETDEDKSQSWLSRSCKPFSLALTGRGKLSKATACAVVVALNVLFLCVASPFFNEVTPTSGVAARTRDIYKQVVDIAQRFQQPKVDDTGRPEEFHCCGNWQEDYMELHRAILAGELPPRYVVSVGVEEGLADRITGIITEFYYALLTQRALQITPGNQPQFEVAYEAPFVNWSIPNYPEKLTQPINNRVVLSGKGFVWEEDVNMTKYGFMDWANHELASEKPNDDFYVKDLRTLPENHSDAEYVFISSNRGRTHDMFMNPFHSAQLQRWGLKPETAFSCAFKFLFKPKPATIATVASQLDVLQNETTALKIGINIRVGDTVFKGNDKVSLEAADAYLNCAKEVSKRKQRGQKLVWYLVSDSLSLRQRIKEAYGDQVITNTEVKVIHPNCHIFGDQACGEQKDSQLTGLQFAAGQLYALSKTDIQIVTKYSGFGRLGAWMSAGCKHKLTFYDIYGPQSCGVMDNTPLIASARIWAGV